MKPINSHVLGFGLLWNYWKLIPMWVPEPPLLYFGKNGIIGNEDIGLTGDPVVEDTGSLATIRVHWKKT